MIAHLLAVLPHAIGVVGLAFTLVPLPDDTKLQLVDQAASEGLVSWIVNNDGSVAVSLSAGQFKFMPTHEDG